MDQYINNSISHLEAALKIVNANELVLAQEYFKAAGQSSKGIIGGSSNEVKAQRGHNSIKKAHHQLREGDIPDAADSINQTCEKFKALLRPDEASSRDGFE